VSPVPASSGKTRRHRLNRGGDRQANRALYVIVITHPHAPRHRHPRLPAAPHHRGLSKKEIIRCLKRYIARELYKILTSPKTRNQDLAPAA
jgi:transposase